MVETEIGRIGCAICYDWLFPETIRQLAFNGAEVLIRVSAYMDPWGATPPMDWWTLFNRARAVENTALVVACNQGASLAQYGPFSWPGGSMMVDWDGRVLAQASPGPGEQIVSALSTTIRREGASSATTCAGIFAASAHHGQTHLAPAGGCPAPDELAARIARSRALRRTSIRSSCLLVSGHVSSRPDANG